LLHLHPSTDILPLFFLPDINCLSFLAIDAQSEIDHLTGLVLVNELIDLHNAYIRTASTTKPLKLLNPTPKAQSAIKMLTKICPTPGYVALLNHILTYKAILVKNALTLVSLWCKAHALAINAQSAQSC
jgi:hypothetical protein